MKKNLMVAILSASAPILAFGSANEMYPGKSASDPFEASGVITRYYGGHRSAEALMWKNALKSCEQLDSGFLLNRVSQVKYSFEGVNIKAQATFVCVKAGYGR